MAVVLGSNCLGGSCPGGSCPVAVVQVAVSRWQLSGYPSVYSQKRLTKRKMFEILLIFPVEKSMSYFLF